MKEPLHEKFWIKVAEREFDECWNWLGQVSKYGYGILYDKGKRLAVHRYSYKINKGKIPKGLCVCHSCDNRLCVNPKHLWLGTISDNIKDRDLKGRGNKGKKYKKFTK